MQTTETVPSKKPPAAQPAFWDIPLAQLLSQLRATPQGLSSEEARARLRQYGPNSLKKESRFKLLGEFFRLFLNPLVDILLIASIISFALGDHVSSVIIIAIVLMSIIMNFYQEFQASHAVEALRSQVATTATVLRDGKEQNIAGGRAGTRRHHQARCRRSRPGGLPPAGWKMICMCAKRRSPVNRCRWRKRCTTCPRTISGINDADNSVFLGTSVQTGIATALVVATGAQTAFGDIAARLASAPPETEFDRGIRQFGLLHHPYHSAAGALRLSLQSLL